jgi:DNA-directed RNA polymerase subunit M/transcription elongation factor TFIIS
MPPKKETVQALLLTQKAEVKEITIPLGADGKLSTAIMKTTLKKKEAPEVVGTYPYKSQTLFLLGYTTGKAGTENKHELPPPHDTMLCFGDIILLASKDDTEWSKPVTFKSAEYEVFYTKAFGGFEDLDEEEDLEEEVEEEAANEVEEDGDVEAEGDEEDGEEGAEDAEDDGAKGLEDDICEEPIIVPKKRAKKAAATSIVSAGAAQVYASYFHVDASNELAEEEYDAPYVEDSLVSHRKKILGTLSKLFRDLLSPAELHNLERCIYNGAIRRASQRHIGKVWTHTPFLELYIMFAKQISVNLLPTAYVNNTELFAKYKAGEVTFKDISEMDSYQLFEDRWKDCFLEQQIREKRQLEGNKAMATDRFLCKRCHKRECTYYELQTRSADEPMTIFITCLNCGKHWKE